MLPVLLIELLQSLDPGLERGLDLAPLLGDLGLGVASFSLPKVTVGTIVNNRDAFI